MPVHDLIIVSLIILAIAFAPLLRALLVLTLIAPLWIADRTIALTLYAIAYAGTWIMLRVWATTYTPEPEPTTDPESSAAVEWGLDYIARDRGTDEEELAA